MNGSLLETAYVTCNSLQAVRRVRIPRPVSCTEGLIVRLAFGICNCMYVWHLAPVTMPGGRLRQVSEATPRRRSDTTGILAGEFEVCAVRWPAPRLRMQRPVAVDSEMLPVNPEQSLQQIIRRVRWRHQLVTYAAHGQVA